MSIERNIKRINTKFWYFKDHVFDFMKKYVRFISQRRNARKTNIQRVRVALENDDTNSLRKNSFEASLKREGKEILKKPKLNFSQNNARYNTRIQDCCRKL